MLHAELATLPNGLRVVTAPDPNAESVTFALMVDSGSRHEKPRLAGISHFIEHMLFKGTPARSAREINRAIEGRGGILNAFTSESVTCFYARLPCEFLPVAADVICDMYLNAAIPDAEFARERQVVLQEIRMYEDEPDSVAAERLGACLFPGNPVGAPIAGSEKTLAPLVPQDLRDYIRRAYVPSATVAVVTGNFDPGDAVALLRESLGGARRGRGLKYRRFDDSVPVVRESTVEKDVAQTQLAFGWRIPFGARDPRRFALSVLDGIMGRGMSSRLFETVRERRGLSYDIHSQGQLFDDIGEWTVSGGTDPKRADAMRALVLREVERLRAKKAGAAELRRVKDLLEGHFRLSFERATTRVFYYGGAILTYGRIVPPEEAVEGIERVTAEEVRALAAEFLVPERMAVSRVVPK